MKHEFFIHVDDIPKRLFVSRPKENGSKAFSPCDMTPEDVDYEMSTGKHPEILQINGMNQKSLEHFAANYAQNYRYLYFFKCQTISDFSPLQDLKKLERVDVYWNIRSKNLWDFSGNTALKTLRIMDAKQITFNPSLLDTSPTLEDVSFYGSSFNNTPMENLDVFGRMPALKSLTIRNIRLKDKRVDFLAHAENLKEFDFDPGMFTTEEIAWMVANYPDLAGSCLGACSYNPRDTALNDVRICGFRKPSLDLPQHQKRLDKYIAEFNALVEKYRNE